MKRTDYESTIKGIKDGEVKDSVLKLDIIRVLIVNSGTSWKSTLLKNIKIFRKDTNRHEKVWEDRYEDALTNLENADLIEMVEQTKATRKGGKEDAIISLTDLRRTSSALSEDDILRNYMEKLKELYSNPDSSS